MEMHPRSAKATTEIVARSLKHQKGHPLKSRNEQGRNQKAEMMDRAGRSQFKGAPHSDSQTASRITKRGRSGLSPQQCPPGGATLAAWAPLHEAGTGHAVASLFCVSLYLGFPSLCPVGRPRLPGRPLPLPHTSPSAPSLVAIRHLCSSNTATGRPDDTLDVTDRPELETEAREGEPLACRLLCELGFGGIMVGGRSRLQPKV